MRDLIEKIANRNERILLAINGLPLCGKSTLADGISGTIGGERITTSTALRALNNPTVNYKIDNGILVEDEIVVGAVTLQLRRSKENLVIIDGCFRRAGQTRSIVGMAHFYEITHIVAMEVEVSYPTIRHRLNLNGRNRNDDTLQKVANRIREYKGNQTGVRLALRDLTRFQVSINGDQNKEGVLQEALRKFEGCLEDILEPTCPFKGRVTVNC